MLLIAGAIDEKCRPRIRDAFRGRVVSSALPELFEANASEIQSTSAIADFEWHVDGRGAMRQ